MKYKNIQFGGNELIKQEFINLLISKNFDRITDDMIQYVNDLFNINNNSYHLLYYFIEINEYIIVKWLLNLPNIDVNLKNSFGNSPLFIATKNNIDVVNLLLNNSTINVNVQNNNGDTPLHNAIYYNNIDIVDLLLNYSTINVNLKRITGSTPLHFAIIRKNLNIFKKMIDKIEYNNNNYNNLLMHTIQVLHNDKIIDLNNHEMVSLILDKIIKKRKEITMEEYSYITCWSTNDETSLFYFNKFIQKYHQNFPDLKKRYEYAKNHYDNFIQTDNNKQYIINAHGEGKTNYFIVPFNVILIMHTFVENPAYTFKNYNVVSNDLNIVPPCFINKNYNEYINSMLKINPIVYISGSLIKNINMIFYEYSDEFVKFGGIFNVKQITNEQFTLSQEDINNINNWNNNNVHLNADFRLKYTDTNILTINDIKLKNYMFNLSDIVNLFKTKFPNEKIILHVITCRTCISLNNDNIEDICKTTVEQIPIMKTKRRGSFSLDAIDNDTFNVLQSTHNTLNTSLSLDIIDNDIFNVLQSTHNKFQDIFDFVINNSNNDNYIININENYNIEHTLDNRDICYILEKYINLKNILKNSNITK